MTKKFTVGLIVSNHFGVLNRVAGLYAKRAYNIDSLAVGVTENENYSRITIVSTGDDYMQKQVVRQLRKLHDVKMVALLTDETAISAEHLLIKIKATPHTAIKISELLNAHGGKTLEFGGEFITAEITATPDKITAFIEQAKTFGIFEICRSGALALSHGIENMLSNEQLEAPCSP